MHRQDTRAAASDAAHPAMVGTPVFLRVWGATLADQGCAVHKAGQGWSRATWNFVEIERLTGGVCPLDVLDPNSIAAGVGRYWAYVAYPAAAA
jgi:hypothetical protein